MRRGNGCRSSSTTETTRPRRRRRRLPSTWLAILKMSASRLGTSLGTKRDRPTSPPSFQNADYEGLAANRPAITREAKAERSRVRAAILALRHLRDSRGPAVAYGPHRTIYLAAQTGFDWRRPPCNLIWAMRDGAKGT